METSVAVFLFSVSVIGAVVWLLLLGHRNGDDHEPPTMNTRGDDTGPRR